CHIFHSLRYAYDIFTTYPAMFLRQFTRDMSNAKIKSCIHSFIHFSVMTLFFPDFLALYNARSALMNTSFTTSALSLLQEDTPEDKVTLGSVFFSTFFRIFPAISTPSFNVASGKYKASSSPPHRAGIILFFEHSTRTFATWIITSSPI